MGKITYTRGTTYSLTVNYTAPTYLGATMIFTAKSVSSDSDATDTDNQLFTPKEVSMSGSSFPQTTVLTIGPTDIPPSIDPSNNYYYSIKVIDSNGDDYVIDSGTFVLKAVTTNKTS